MFLRLKVLIAIEVACIIVFGLTVLHVLPTQPTYGILGALAFPDLIAVVWLKQRQRRREWTQA